MGKKTFAFLLVVYVALLIGCSGGANSPNLKVDDDYRTGTGTVQLTFDSMTSSKMYEGENGIVVIRAKNSGAYTLDSGRIVLTSDDSIVYFGSKDQYEGSEAPTNTKNLVRSNDRPFFGKSAVSPSGDQLVYDFPIYALPLPQESQQRSAKIIAVACFPYETFQTENVCIDADPYDLKTAKEIKSVCDAKDVSMSSGGGPINVQEVQVRFASDADFEVSPTFYFTVRASGISGASSMKYFAPGGEQSFCDSRISSSIKNNDLVYMRATLSDRALICNGEIVPGYRNVYAIKLYDNIVRVSCTTDGPLFMGTDIIGNYYAPLTVNLSYGVVVSASQTLQVTALR